MTYRPMHVYDALPSPPDRRDRIAAPIDVSGLPDHAALPNVDVLDQGAEGACVGHGCAGARETLEAVAGRPVVPLSRAFVYYEARKLEHTQRQDSGAYVRDGCKVMNKLGVCTEAQFPYKAGDFAKIPPAADVKLAAAYRIATYTSLGTADQVRQALAAGLPVVIGISVYESFERAIGADGMVPMADPAREQLLGGHCVFLWGYHPDPTSPGRFVFDAQNSWGPGWADHGRMHFPQAYIADANLCGDRWSIAL